MANHFKDPDEQLQAPAPEPFVTLHDEPAHAAPSKKEARRRARRERRRQKHKWYRAPLLFLVSLAGVAAALYAAGYFAFSNVCYPGTTIGGVDVSLMTRSTAVSRLSSSLVNYRLTLTYEDFEWTYTPESTDDILDAGAAFDRIVETNDPVRWPLHLYEALFGTDTAEDVAEEAEELELPSSFDTEAFTAEVAAAVEEYNSGRSGTFDKASAYDEELGAFTVEMARSNQVLDADAVASAALVGLASLARTVELDSSYTVPLAGGATDEELQEICDAANTIISSSITLTMGGTEVGTITGDLLLEWLTMDESYNFSLDEEALADWVGDLADELDTVGSKRTYTRADGEVITVTGGTYGWISDEATLCETIIAAVAEGELGEIEVPTKQEGDVYTAYGERDWGAYIDVDLSEQYAIYYDEDGEILWESGVITANTTKGYETPTGIYYIVKKLRDVTLTGELQDDGSYSYETPVSYWMAFVGGSIGFHDATWQDEEDFGVPGINTTTGSHGCVNLPLAAAAELYDLVEVGLCVIVHK